MDAWETMKTMADLFTEIVTGYRLVEDAGEEGEPDDDAPSVAQLVSAINKNFYQLQEFARGGKHFDQVAYAAEMLQRTYAAEEAGDSDSAWEYFYHYCEFITAVWELRDFRELIIRFRKSDLAEWTRLRLDLETFGGFAKGFIDGTEEIFARGGRINAEVALHVKATAELYGIDVSLGLRALLEFELSDSSEDAGDEDALESRSLSSLQ